jgi:hypothetical protein
MAMRIIMRTLVATATAVGLAACGTATGGGSQYSPQASQTSAPTSAPTEHPTSTPTQPPVPDAASIARVLLAVPTSRRPSFLDPYGAAIHGERLGLGPSVRISGYRADPLFVCVQHVDMRHGTTGLWTSFAVGPGGRNTQRHGMGGSCPQAPGSTQINE